MKKKFLLLLLISCVSFGQKKKLEKSSQENAINQKIELVEKKKKPRNSRSINYNASNLWDAIRPVLGANIIFRDGKALINTGTLFATGNNYVIWVVNGVILGVNIPEDINIYDIEKVTFLRKPMETEKYGFRGSAGVIEINLK
ncbi:MAG: hypothetical protein CMC25_00530 [Flavobacteriaceae bacterium]|nr:hypothetical protein [Flavobacteriaceae bacterium]|tara:strand:- start:623 stop:1051 length:429 start_codon:yes stop_codon:yes gene_type:complete